MRRRLRKEVAPAVTEPVGANYHNSHRALDEMAQFFGMDAELFRRCALVAYMQLMTKIRQDGGGWTTVALVPGSLEKRMHVGEIDRPLPPLWYMALVILLIGVATGFALGAWLD